MWEIFAWTGGIVLFIGFGALVLRHRKSPDLRPILSHKIIGHRGCRFVSGVEENTMAAFKYAVEQGADGVECDVHLTKDKELVVYHNHTLLNASTGETITLSDSTLDEIRRAVGGRQLPTLDELVQYCQRVNKILLIEIKSWKQGRECARRVVNLLRTQSIKKDSVIIISFNPFALSAVKSMEPQMGLIYLTVSTKLCTIANFMLRPGGLGYHQSLHCLGTCAVGPCCNSSQLVYLWGEGHYVTEDMKNTFGLCCAVDGQFQIA